MAASARRLVMAGAMMVVLAACTEPSVSEQPPPGEDTDEILSADVLDPARDELLAAIETLAQTVGAARDELESAANAGDLAAVRRSASAALALLLEDPDTSTAAPTALFPARSVQRSESAAQGDLLRTTLASARESGGPLGRATVEVLRDPIAGDLGAWERDAEGVVAAAAATVDGRVRGIDEVADAVLELPADGVRALAWTLLATSTTDLGVAREAAERATGHLAVVLITLALLEEDPAAEAEDAQARGDAAEAGS